MWKGANEKSRLLGQSWGLTQHGTGKDIKTDCSDKAKSKQDDCTLPGLEEIPRVTFYQCRRIFFPGLENNLAHEATTNRQLPQLTVWLLGWTQNTFWSDHTSSLRLNRRNSIWKYIPISYYGQWPFVDSGCWAKLCSVPLKGRAAEVSSTFIAVAPATTKQSASAASHFCGNRTHKRHYCGGIVAFFFFPKNGSSQCGHHTVECFGLTSTAATTWSWPMKLGTNLRALGQNNGCNFVFQCCN